MRLVLSIGVVALVSAATVPAQAQPTDAASLVATLHAQYWGAPNVTYLVADNYEAKLDVFVPRRANASHRVPTVIFFHGGGWEGGDKFVGTLRLLPYLEMGFAAVNVNYRTGTAPAAVEDGRCALRWVIRNAAQYGFDVNKIVVTGESAGSHLALTTGMLPVSAGLDTRCPGSEELKVAAIVNWYGVTDVVDVSEGPHQQPYAVRWLARAPNARETAQRVSPIQYVRSGLPAIVTVHGDADMVAPYEHAVRLHAKLSDAKVPNQLITIPGRGHGDFTSDDLLRSYSVIRVFLAAHVTGGPSAR